MQDFSIQKEATQDTVQKVEKKSQESFTTAIGEVSNLPLEIASQKEALALHIEKLDKVHSRFLSCLTMSENDKAIVHEFQTKQKQAVGIVLEQRNKSMSMFANASLVYSQRFLEKLLEMTGATTEAQSAVYVETIHIKLMHELERITTEFNALYEAKLLDQTKRSSELQSMIERQKQILQERFISDYELLLNRFSKIIRTTVA